jgi:hypothetical protein
MIPSTPWRGKQGRLVPRGIWRKTTKDQSSLRGRTPWKESKQCLAQKRPGTEKDADMNSNELVSANDTQQPPSTTLAERQGAGEKGQRPAEPARDGRAARSFARSLLPSLSL